MFICCHIYFCLLLQFTIIHITCILVSLHRTSAPIHLTSVLGVLGTQETSCILISGLLERDIFDIYLPEFDKHWVIYLRETFFSSTNLCTWRPNTVYKNRSVRRHHPVTHPLLLDLNRPKYFKSDGRERPRASIWIDRPDQSRRAKCILQP